MPLPEYPPPIGFADFADPPPAVARMDLPMIPLRALRSHFHSTRGSHSDLAYLSLARLELVVGLASQVLVHPDNGAVEEATGEGLSFALAHPAPIASAAPTQRTCFAPIIEHFLVGWTLCSPDLVRALAIEIFRRGVATPVWSRTLTWTDSAPSARGSFLFDGDLGTGGTITAGGDPTVTAGGRHDDVFPTDCLSAAHGPYKLKVTVAPREGTNRYKTTSRWVYLDVLVHDITVAFGTTADIPATRADITDGPAAAWTHGEEQTLLTGLRNAGPVTAAAQVVALNSHRFRSGVEQAGTTGITQHQARWGDGPRIPLVATIKVRSSTGAAVDAPRALGGARFLWDWDDPRATAPTKAWEDWVDPHTTARTRHFLDGTVTLREHTTALKSYNCPVAYGGKFGPGGAPVFLPFEADPFGFAASVPRPWAAITSAGTDGHSNTTALLFQPSRMASDTYKVAVYLLPPAGFPDADPGDQLRASAGQVSWPSAVTGTFEVTRTLHVEYLYVKTVAPGYAALVSTYRRQGGVLLDVVRTDFNATYALRLAAGVDAAIANFPNPAIHALRFMLLPAATGVGVPLRNHDEFRAAILHACQNNHVYKVPVASGDVKMGWHRTGHPTERFHVVLCKLEGHQHYAYFLGEDAVTTLSNGDSLTCSKPGGPPPPPIPITGATALVAVGGARQALYDEALRSPTLKILSDQGTANTPSEYTVVTLSNNWPKSVLTETFRLIEQNDFGGLAEGVFCLDFDGVMSTEPVGGSSLYAANSAKKSFVYTGSPAQNPARRLFKSGSDVVVHEMAHAIFFDHAENVLRDGAGTASGRQPTPLLIEQHLPHDSCVMNYDHDADCFCGLCMLHLRGWNYAAVPHDDVATRDNLEPALADIDIDIRSGRYADTNWLKLRAASLLAMYNKNVRRHAVKDRVDALIRPLAPTGVAVGAERITHLRSILVTYVEALDRCDSLPGNDVHKLRRELLTLVNHVATEGDAVEFGLPLADRLGEGFCVHHAVPQVRFTSTAQSHNRREIELSATDGFDGTGTLACDRPQVRFFASDTAVHPIASPVFNFTELDPANPTRLWVEDTSGTPFVGLAITLTLAGGTCHLRPESLTATAVTAVVRAAASIGHETARMIFVRKSGTDQPVTRRKITLKVDRVFDGQGVLTASNTHLRFYHRETGGDPIALDGVANAWPAQALRPGVELWVESEMASAAKHDITLTLTLAAAGNARFPAQLTHATLQLTAVQVVLDICADRPNGSTANPMALVATDKYTPGRLIAAQSGGQVKRASVVVARVLPTDFDGKVMLSARDARVQVFREEVPGARQRPLTLPLVRKAKDVAMAGQRYWLEGVSASAELGDTGLDLGVIYKGLRYPAVDRVAVTVLPFTVTARVPITPTKTDRGGVGFPNVRAAHHDLTLQLAHGGDFEQETPLILLRDAVPTGTPVVLTVVCPIAGAVVSNLALVRAGDDHQRCKSFALPTFTPNANSATLLSDSFGSFHVTATVTVGGQTQDGLVCACIVIVDVAIVEGGDRSVVKNPEAGLMLDTGCLALYYQKAGTDLYPRPKTMGMMGGFRSSSCAVLLQAVVTVIGGGPQGKRGVDRIVGGWINNQTRVDCVAEYAALNGTGPKRVEVLFATNRAQATTTPPFAPEEPGFELVAPAAVALTAQAGLLDTGAGGEPYLSSNRWTRHDPLEQGMSQGTYELADVFTPVGPAALGRTFVIEAMDSPSTNHDLTHLRQPTSYLQRFRQRCDFSAYLCFWVDQTPVPQRLYGVLRRVDWRVEAEWTLHWNPNPPPGRMNITTADFTLAAPNSVTTSVLLPTATQITARSLRRLTPATATDLEVAKPTTHALKARDYR